VEKASGRYRTIKALVFDYVHRTQGRVSYDVLTEAVLAAFPGSQWKRSHWAWYRSQIRRGRFREEFSDEERDHLGEAGGAVGAKVSPERPGGAGEAEVSGGRAPRRGPAARDPEVKRLGDPILKAVRSAISERAGDDVDLGFKLNRWVFSRLHLDERRVKEPIKKALWESQVHSCSACGQRFSSLKGVELHRTDATKGYSVDNCELLCRECHQELAG